MTNNLTFKQLRKQHGLSQNDLAKKLYVSRSAVSMWDIGAASPTLDIIPKITDIFGCDDRTVINALLEAKNAR